MITPFRQFCNGLHQVRNDLNEQIDEMLAFSEVMAHKQNSVEVDSDGFFYVTASGPLDEVLITLHKQQDKLQRIKKQRDNQH